VHSSEISCTHDANRLGNNIAAAARIYSLAMEMNKTASKVSRINRYVQLLCGMYSRIARQLGVDRSYVSRVARGERRSEAVEHALTTEFDRITDEARG